MINGWQHIHSGRKGGRGAESHFDKARQELLTATTRGIPVYTEGLRLLNDGLRLIFAQNKTRDTEIAAALELVTPLADAAEVPHGRGGSDYGKAMRLLRDGLHLCHRGRGPRAASRARHRRAFRRLGRLDGINCDLPR